MTATAILNSPIAWGLFGLVFVPLIIHGWISLWRKAIDWTSRKGWAKTAKLESLIDSAGEGVLASMARGTSPQDALAHGKAAVIAAYAADKGIAVQEAASAVGELVESRLRTSANLAPQSMTGISPTAPSANFAVNMPVAGAKPLT